MKSDCEHFIVKLRFIKSYSNRKVGIQEKNTIQIVHTNLFEKTCVRNFLYTNLARLKLIYLI